MLFSKLDCERWRKFHSPTSTRQPVHSAPHFAISASSFLKRRSSSKVSFTYAELTLINPHRVLSLVHTYLLRKVVVCQKTHACGGQRLRDVQHRLMSLLGRCSVREVASMITALGRNCFCHVNRMNGLQISKIALTHQRKDEWKGVLIIHVRYQHKRVCREGLTICHVPLRSWVSQIYAEWRYVQEHSRSLWRPTGCRTDSRQGRTSWSIHPPLRRLSFKRQLFCYTHIERANDPLRALFCLISKVESPTLTSAFVAVARPAALHNTESMRPQTIRDMRHALVARNDTLDRRLNLGTSRGTYIPAVRH